MRIAVVGSLSEVDAHVLGNEAVVAGPSSTWTGAWFGSGGKVYRDGLHLLTDHGVAIVVGGDAAAMLAQAESCPYKVLVVCHHGSAKGRAYKALEAMSRSRHGAVLARLDPGSYVALEVVDGRVYFVGGSVGA